MGTVPFACLIILPESKQPPRLDKSSTNARKVIVLELTVWVTTISLVIAAEPNVDDVHASFPDPVFVNANPEMFNAVLVHVAVAENVPKEG
jgi:hypothetical protein